MNQLAGFAGVRLPVVELTRRRWLSSPPSVDGLRFTRHKRSVHVKHRTFPVLAAAIISVFPLSAPAQDSCTSVCTTAYTYVQGDCEFQAAYLYLNGAHIKKFDGCSGVDYRARAEAHKQSLIKKGVCIDGD
jgi:hypothetical protein